MAACGARPETRPNAARCCTNGWSFARRRHGQAEVAAFEAGLKELDWHPGGNIVLDYRWPGAEFYQVTITANEIAAA